MPQTKIEDVPNDVVPPLKRSLERAGATKVDVKDNGDGTSDVTATFPAKQTHAELVAKVSVGKPAAV